MKTTGNLLSHNNLSWLSDNFSGYGKRVLIYSHDTFGLGHLQRCLKISNALIEHYPKLSILLVTGSPVVHRFQLPPGVDYVKLPAVRKVGPEEYEARTLGTTYRRILSMRTNILLQTVQDYKPHLLLVDHSPLGMKNEMYPSLQWLNKSGIDCIKVLGLRDIIDDPETVQKLWKKEGIFEVCEEFYDKILVYGSPNIYDLTREYNFSKTLKEKTCFCNYITKNYQKVDVKDDIKKPLVVVTVGGGDGAGEVIIGNYISMVQEYRDQIDFTTVVLTGSFLDEQLVKKFRKESLGLPIRIMNFVNDTESYFRKSDLVVSTSGYNTVTELMGCAKKALLIPRVMHRQEQSIRSESLSRFNFVSMLHPKDVTPQSLYRKITLSLENKRNPLSDARESNDLKLDGSLNFAAFVGDLFVENQVNVAQEKI